MLTAKNLLYSTCILSVVCTFHNSCAMDLRHNLLESNALQRLLKKTDRIIEKSCNDRAILANELQNLSPDEQYLLLKKLTKRLSENPPLSLERRALFVLLKAVASPSVVQRAFPAAVTVHKDRPLQHYAAVQNPNLTEIVEEEPCEGYIPIPPSCNQP